MLTELFEDVPPRRTRVVSGPLDAIATVVKGLAAERAFVVTDPGIVVSGHAGRLLDLLFEARLSACGFDAVRENPTEVDVARCSAAVESATVERFGGREPDIYVAIGGGSSIDVAKACMLVRGGGGSIGDYRSAADRGLRLPKLIAVPTTAGTGSEVQSFALIGSEETHEKVACGDPAIAPHIAFLDAGLTLTMPPFVTACTGLDTLGHALEALVTKKGNEVSRRCALASFELANHAFERVLKDGSDLEAREAMLRAAALGGLAIENSMLGAAHSIANALTASLGLAHGEAVALALPHVLRFNAELPPVAAVYAEAARRCGLASTSDDDRVAAAKVAERVEELTRLAGVEVLARRRLDDSASRGLATVAARQWTASFNPRPVDERDLEGLVAAVFGRR
ncbi:MAG TPA: iron-containing alcohol dehydrogenase [Planctomycetota bacterium]|nr:iron-containing alcohol dehydrogenase [Planctomycetota bacterium]